LQNLNEVLPREISSAHVYDYSVQSWIA